MIPRAVGWRIWMVLWGLVSLPGCGGPGGVDVGSGLAAETADLAYSGQELTAPGSVLALFGGRDELLELVVGGGFDQTFVKVERIDVELADDCLVASQPDDRAPVPTAPFFFTGQSSDNRQRIESWDGQRLIDPAAGKIAPVPEPRTVPLGLNVCAVVLQLSDSLSAIDVAGETANGIPFALAAAGGYSLRAPAIGDIHVTDANTGIELVLPILWWLARLNDLALTRDNLTLAATSEQGRELLDQLQTGSYIRLRQLAPANNSVPGQSLRAD